MTVDVLTETCLSIGFPPVSVLANRWLEPLGTGCGKTGLPKFRREKTQAALGLGLLLPAAD